MITGEKLTLRDYLAITYTLHTHCINIAYTLHAHCIHIDFVNSFSHQIKITLRCIKLMLLHLADFSSKTFIVANCGFWGG